MHVYYELLVTSILILVLFPYSAKIRHSPTYFPRVKKVKVTGKNKKGKKLSKTLKCAVTVKTPVLNLDKSTATVEAGGTVKITATAKPASAQKSVTYTTSDSSIATVAADGTVTGVAAGTATITATAKSGTKTLTKTVTVTVTEAAAAVAELSAVTQTASDAFTAAFTLDASNTVTKDDITVEKTDKTASLEVKSLVFAADGKTATVTLNRNMENGVKYSVTIKGVTKEIDAKVGAVTKVEILTKTAQQGKDTKIDFRLWDADGIDVTPAKEIDSTCQITVTGDYQSAERTPSKAAITMAKIGDKAEVEIIYDTGAKEFVPLTGKGTIECVKAEATEGTAAFKVSSVLNQKSSCEKFYKEDSDKEVSVAEGKEKTVFFCATNAGKTEAVNYDKYEVESANENVFSVSAVKDNGKYLEIVVTGNNAGSAAINVSATKYGAVSSYRIPVTVTKDEVATRMEASIDRTEMSNSPDPDYKATVSVKFYDANGVEVTKDTKYSVEITNTSDKQSQSSADGVTIANGNEFKIDATGCSGDYKQVKPKTYQLRVTGQDTVADKTFVKVLNVTVKKLSEDAFAAKGAAMVYKLEMAKSKVNEEAAVKNTADGKNKVRVYAECGNLFAGYVDQNGEIATNQIHATTATQITSVGVAVSYGNEYYTNTAANATSCDLVYDMLAATNTRAGAKMPIDTTNRYVEYSVTGSTLKDEIKLPSVTSGGAIYPISLSGCTYGDGASVATGYIAMNYGKETDFQTLAKTGRWNVELIYNDNGGKEVVKSNTFTVEGLGFTPKVTAGDRDVSALSFDEINKALSTNVDMNNDNGSNISIVGLIYTDKDSKQMVCAHAGDSVAATNTDGTKTFIKYAVVVDNVDGGATPIYYCVPLNVTFTLK